MTPTGEPIPLNFEFMQHSFHQRADLGSSQPQHVAQQIRRDKLRIQQHVSSSPPSSSTPSSRISDPILQAQEVEESRNSELSRSGYSGLPGIGGLIPLRYDPNSMISAEMMSSSSAGRLPSFKDSVPESNNGWKSLNYQASTDRIVNCMQNPSAQSPAMGSTVLGSVGGFPIYNLGGQPSPAVMNPNCGGREDVQRDQVHQSQFLSPAPQEIKVREQSHGLLLPSFGNMPSVQWGFNEWNHKQGGLKPQWVEDSFIGREAINGWFRTDATGQGLSLSLSFRNPTPESQLQHETRFGTENFAACPASACTIGHHEKRKQEPVGDCFSFHKDGPAASISRIEKSPVPLGPFTGYATVLKSSKFLKPAQQLLDELCNVGKVAISSSSTSDDDGNIGKFQTNNDQIEMDGQYGDSGISCGIPSDKLVNPPPCTSSSVYLSANAPAEQDRRNEHRRKKNRLISMLDEVYRKYRHFCGQLQAVLASFESVAGLSNAAPYTSMAVKAMSRYFHHLKNAINSQLKFTGKVLGEDCFLSSTVRGDEISKLGLKAGRLQQRDAGCLRISEPQQQQQVWRPQRGLPERAVAVLRAWLFEHFLHPYPTDTDKQTLAKQTGLTRSQVSNWFINARVRLWKPMVEEIHMMESRNSSSSEFNSVSRPESVAIIGERRRSQAAPPPDGRQNCDSSDHPHGHLLPTKQWQTNVSQIPIFHDRGIDASSTLYQQNEASVKATPTTGGIGGVYLSLGP